MASRNGDVGTTEERRKRIATSISMHYSCLWSITLKAITITLKLARPFYAFPQPFSQQSLVSRRGVFLVERRVLDFL